MSSHRQFWSSAASLLVCFVISTQLIAASRVMDCRPCSLILMPDQPAFDFSFNILSTGNDERTLQSIDVSSAGFPSQRLVVHDAQPVSGGEKFLFGAADLQTSGYGFVMLLTSLGEANAYAQYWLYVPERKTFVDLGTFPVLRVDKHLHAITSHERGGHGGREFKDTLYTLEREKLVVGRVLQQVWNQALQGYVKTVSERHGEVLEQISREIVKDY